MERYNLSVDPYKKKEIIYMELKTKNFVKLFIFIRTVCPRSREPLCIVSYYIKWVTTSWTLSMLRNRVFRGLNQIRFAPNARFLVPFPLFSNVCNAGYKIWSG